MTAPTRAAQFRDVPEGMATKSHYVIERWGSGWAVTVRRRGQQPVTTTCMTQGEVNRLRRELSDEGLPGFNGGAS